MSRKNAVKTRGRPFKPGNPGKPKGCKHKLTMAAQTLLDGEAAALTRKAIDMALEGDSTAMRLCLERICPPRKMRFVSLDLPEAKTAEGVADAQAAIVDAVAGGELTPDEGTAIAGILEARRKAIETLDHEGRIATLEQSKCLTSAPMGQLSRFA